MKNPIVQILLFFLLGIIVGFVIKYLTDSMLGIWILPPLAVLVQLWKIYKNDKIY
jgi:hypothetical protein